MSATDPVLYLADDTDNYEVLQRRRELLAYATGPLNEVVDLTPAQRPICTGPDGCNIEKACNGGCFCG
jgi:hypothetical protein